MLRKTFNKRIIYINYYLFIFDTKMTIFPRKVRHVLPRRDVCLCLTAKYPYIHILDQNPKESFDFLCLVTLRALFL